ncbi:hypothetical protein F4818DRAFT_456831 [Hypoxylon cercidicola]|nr:hypothetical protein F4818DRAFT_456831 [Hypoxylon cercidicola]
MPSAQLQVASNEAKVRQRIRGGNATKETEGVHEGTAPTDNKDPSEATAEGVSVESSESTAHYRRDLVTGRKLVDDGGSCLRCIEKGLKCTLNFVGVSGVTQCAACKRSNVPHCIRQRPLERRLLFLGPPWKSPNYFTAGEPLSRQEMEEVLKEHFQGREMYSRGMYLPGGGEKKLALPPFNGSDRPIGYRLQNWKTMDWTRVLPIAKNRSYHPRPINLKEEKILPTSAPIPSSASSSPTTTETISTLLISSQETESDDEPIMSEEVLEHMTHSRKYQRRTIHLREYQRDLKETY